MKMIQKKKRENKVYIELHNTYLLLVVLQDNTGELTLDPKTTQIVPLSNLEFDDGVVNNSSTISRFIKNYIATQNLHYPEAIICLRNADGPDKKQQKFMTLQVALLVAKAGLSISEIVHGPIVPWNNTSMLKGSIPKKDLNNKTNLFKLLTPPKHTNPYGWITLSLFFLTTCGAFMVRQYKSKQKEIHNLSLTIKKLNQEKYSLAKRVEGQPVIMEKPKQNQESLLKALAENTPDSTWLTHVKNHNGTLEVFGSTLKNEEIAFFMQNLSKSGLLKNISILQVEMVKKDNSLLYNFKINGDLSA